MSMRQYSYYPHIKLLTGKMDITHGSTASSGWEKLVWIIKRGTNSNFSVGFVNRINKKLVFCRGRSEELW